MIETLANTETFIQFVLIFANLLVGLSFVVGAFTSSLTTKVPGYLWQTVTMRIVGFIILMIVGYDFLRQAVYLYWYPGTIFGVISWHYIGSRCILAVLLPIGLWLSVILKTNRVINPAVESYVDQLIREAEEEATRRQVFDVQVIKEGVRRGAFNETVKEEAPRREAFDIGVGVEQARREESDKEPRAPEA